MYHKNRSRLNDYSSGVSPMALSFYPPFLQKEVIIMTDYEIIAIILMIVTLAFSIHNGKHKD